ncbi:hypothetical protein DH2020_042809 [Rehmannia glutinosa]|uniref:RING-type domain-containing protein n=1 Tax=Rehmannia glutinosa TaxID=99300 RepID=A0ABR0ULD6_REHGL
MVAAWKDQFRVFRIRDRLDSAMVSDSIPNASIALASSNPKDFAKKKRANRSAKLKQCKLDARREQWLSQVKNKGGCKEEVIGGSGKDGGPIRSENERGMPMEKLEIKPRVEEEIHLSSDSEFSPSNSPTSHSINFTASSRSNSSSGRSSSSSISNGCYSGIMSDEDEGDVGDDDCLDDWEAMADALAAIEDNHQKQENSQLGVTNQESGGTAVPRSPIHCQAWRPDDEFRPQSLPNLSKQYSFKLNSERGGSVWGRRNVGPVPTSCPICFEDLDGTDSSFLPCFCGFRLCLFCHKRILEEDARCPGCRKEYECDSVEGETILDGGSLTVRLARSCSMVTRS